MAAVGVAPLYTLKRFDVIPTAILFPLFLIAPVVLFYAVPRGAPPQPLGHLAWVAVLP